MTGSRDLEESSESASGSNSYKKFDAEKALYARQSYGFTLKVGYDAMHQGVDAAIDGLLSSGKSISTLRWAVMGVGKLHFWWLRRR